MKQKISCLIDSNEKGSARASALALACAENPAFEVPDFAELPVDVQFRMVVGIDPHNGWPEVSGMVNVELKVIDDWYASKATGHVGSQIMTMIERGCPGFVAVLGSLDEVHLNVPKIKSVHGTVQKRSQFDIISDLNTSRALSGNAASSNVPVHFLSSNLNLSMKYILSYVKDILEGPNFASFLPRFDVDPRGYCVLASIRNVGDVTSKKTLEALGPFNQLPWAGIGPKDLEKIVGKAKAKCLADAFGVGWMIEAKL
jgi:hypothetical protein